MKYQVSIEYSWQGEFSIEADSEEGAREIVLDETFADPWTDASGDHQVEILEVYEWDEAAQERQRKQYEEIFAKYPMGKQPALLSWIECSRLKDAIILDLQAERKEVVELEKKLEIAAEALTIVSLETKCGDIESVVDEALAKISPKYVLVPDCERGEK